MGLMRLFGSVAALAYNHVHSIVRDPANDYGAEWLKLHYDGAHQN